jgi:hypothetical protein
MQGIITGKDVLRNTLAIVRYWGPATYFRCLRALVSGRPATFLMVACASRPTRS